MILPGQFSQFKSRPLVMATAYDAAFARIAEEAGVDIILVGDSLANVMLAKQSTRQINMSVMEIFVSAVAAGTNNTHITADMPHLSYHDPETALKNARRFLELGAHSVKLEGHHTDIIRKLTDSGVPVIGHLGLLPQTANSLKQVGNTEQEQKDILQAAKDLDEIGVIAIVLEHLSYDLARQVTLSLKTPTIGIGAGKEVNGQVLVLHDLLGIHPDPLPPFARKFADVYNTSLEGLRSYARAVRTREFP
jgi:3-methyl-2-oxobutanoate hydroxymethyltransferase